MKKTILGILGLCLLILLAACDSAAAPDTTTPDTNVDSAEYSGVEDHHYYMMDQASATAKLNLNSGGLQSSTSLVEAQVIGDLMVLEGDMVVAKRSDNLATEAVIRDGGRWSNNTLPYVIDGSLTPKARTAIATAADFYNKNTNLKVVKRTNQRDYVRIVDADGCWSAIGRRGGEQRIGLGKNCGAGAAMHEFGHALGLHHEQSAPNRNDYIRIDCNTVNCDHNWSIARNASLYKNQYDYYSIMHYGAFRSGKQVIFPLKKDISGNTVEPRKIGRTGRLTAQDIAAVNSMYPASNPTPPPAPTPAPAPTPTPPTNPPGNGAGTYRIQINGGSCVDVSGRSVERGTQVIRWDCFNSNNQAFEVRKIGDNNVYTFTAKHSGMNLDVAKGNKSAGAQLIQWNAHSSANQQFTLTRVGNGVQIKAQHSGLCLDAGSAKGTRITQKSCNGSASQQFGLSKLN